MYSDKKKKRWPFWIGMAAAVLTAVIFGSRAICVSGPELEAESAAALKAAIDAEVQIQVEARLKGKAPKTGSGDSGSAASDMEAQMNKIMGL